MYSIQIILLRLTLSTKYNQLPLSGISINNVLVISSRYYIVYTIITTTLVKQFIVLLILNNSHVWNFSIMNFLGSKCVFLLRDILFKIYEEGQ